MQDEELSVATRLKALRERRGWSQNQLYTRSGVHNSTISRIERGEIPSPGIDVLRRLSVALGVDLSEISGEHPMPRRRVEIFEGVAYVPVMRARAQASGRPAWDDTAETIPVDRTIAAGRPNLRAAIVSGRCMGAHASPGDRVVFDPDARPEQGDMVVVTDDEGATMLKWYRVDSLGLPYLRAADVQAWANSRLATLSRTTVSAQLAILSSALKSAGGALRTPSGRFWPRNRRTVRRLARARASDQIEQRTFP